MVRKLLQCYFKKFSKGWLPPCVWYDIHMQEVRSYKLLLYMYCIDFKYVRTVEVKKEGSPPLRAIKGVRSVRCSDYNLDVLADRSLRSARAY